PPPTLFPSRRSSDLLVADFKAGKLSFAEVTTFNLDEYRGLAPEHDQSYRYFMKKHLFDHIDIDQARTHVPEGANADADADMVEQDRKSTRLNSSHVS